MFVTMGKADIELFWRSLIASPYLFMHPFLHKSLSLRSCMWDADTELVRPAKYFRLHRMNNLSAKSFSSSALQNKIA